jgi:hypothetical protein
MYFVGNMGTYLLVLISIERLAYKNIFLLNQSIHIKFYRFLMLRNVITFKSITTTKSIIGIMVSVFLSLVWTTLPLPGWSYYSPEGVNISCGVEWKDHSVNVMSYNVTIFIFAFFLPLLILVVTNFKIIKIVIKFN